MKNLILLVVLATLLTGCADHLVPIVSELDSTAGFFTGVWHGFCAPFAIVGHIFDNSIVVYQTPNNGGWYDFGFVLGVGGFSFGSSKA